MFFVFKQSNTITIPKNFTILAEKNIKNSFTTSLCLKKFFLNHQKKIPALQNWKNHFQIEKEKVELNLHSGDLKNTR